MNSSEKFLAGWGNYPKTSCQVIRPERYKHIRRRNDLTIARGLGRAYGDAALNSDREVILMERLNRFISFQSDTGLLRIESGATLEDILDVFIPRGWMLPVSPGTKYATIGGCVACDVHGKNHHRVGTFGNFIHEMELLLADGSKKRCSPKQNSELFWATIGGMGLTGIISEVTIKLVPIESSYMSVSYLEGKDLETTLELLKSGMCDDDYSVAWVDPFAKGRSIIMNGHHATLSDLHSEIENPLERSLGKRFTLPFSLPSFTVNPFCVRSFNRYYFKRFKDKGGPHIVPMDSYFYPLDRLKNWNRIYGKKGFLQYQFVIPESCALETIEAVFERLGFSSLAVLKRFGKEGKGLLSFPFKGFTLALDIPIRKDNIFDILEEIDQLIIERGGRVYLAKDARMSPQTFRKMYPKYEEWLLVKRSVDPKNSMISDLSRRLHLGREV